MHGWYKVGHICVDSGVVMIGDPCYLLEEKNVKKVEEHLMGDWPVGIKPVIFETEDKKDGYEGAFMSSTEIRDGYYPVYKRLTKKGNWELKVVFENPIFWMEKELEKENENE